MGPHISSSQEEIRRVLDSIRRIVRALRVTSRHAERNLGLSAAQLFVLQRLGQARTLTVNELAEQTLTHQSSVSVVAKRLEEKKLIERSRSDRDHRRVVLRLTLAGRKALRSAPGAAQDRLIQGLRTMPPTRRAALAGMLEELVERTGISDHSASLFFEESGSKNA